MMADESMRAAVWSVYYEAAGCRRSLLPPGVRPIRLEHALDILLAHRDQHGGARRRRALLALGAANLHRPERARPDVAHKVSQLREALDVDEHLLDDVGTPDGRKAAIELLTKAARTGTGCVVVNRVEIEVTYDPLTHASKLETKVLVNQPLAAMGAVMDPRCWKDCSDFFAESYAIDPKANRPVDKGPRGQPWSGHLFERFETPVSSFDNILNIDFRVQNDRIDMQYSLYDTMRFTFSGLELPGVLEVDSGFARAVAAPGQHAWTEMTMTKRVVFRDLTPLDPAEGGFDQGQWLNYCAPATLGLWADDSSQSRLCCRHPLGG